LPISHIVALAVLAFFVIGGLWLLGSFSNTNKDPLLNGLDEKFNYIKDDCRKQLEKVLEKDGCNVDLKLKYLVEINIVNEDNETI